MPTMPHFPSSGNGYNFESLPQTTAAERSCNNTLSSGSESWLRCRPALRYQLLKPILAQSLSGDEVHGISNLAKTSPWEIAQDPQGNTRRLECQRTRRASLQLRKSHLLPR